MKNYIEKAKKVLIKLGLVALGAVIGISYLISYQLYSAMVHFIR